MWFMYKYTHLIILSYHISIGIIISPKLLRRKRRGIRPEEIKENMNNFCFNKSSTGYFYIIQCIKECVYNKKILSPLETNLYQIISKRNNLKSNLHVKWAIDKSINSMNKYTDTSTLYKYFSIDKVTSKTFISTLSQEIISDLDKIKYRQ